MQEIYCYACLVQVFNHFKFPADNEYTQLFKLKRQSIFMAKKKLNSSICAIFETLVNKNQTDAAETKISHQKTVL